jgi:hypothetical protein
MGVLLGVGSGGEEVGIGWNWVAKAAGSVGGGRVGLSGAAVLVDDTVGNMFWLWRSACLSSLIQANRKASRPRNKSRNFDPDLTIPMSWLAGLRFFSQLVFCQTQFFLV